MPYMRPSSSSSYGICEGDTIPGYVAATKQSVNTNILEQVRVHGFLVINMGQLATYIHAGALSLLCSGKIQVSLRVPSLMVSDL